MQRARVAAIQMTATDDVDRNLTRTEALVRRAAAEGATFVALPENFALMATEGLVLARTEPIDGPIVAWGRALAHELRITLLLGSIPERAKHDGMRRNTSVLVGADGGIAAVYRKIHLFDVDLGELVLRESAAVEPGTEIVVAHTEWAEIGLSVCYDVRFPELYRALRDRGAEVLTVPAAFTAETGPHHWHVLLRARAIENQCFVVAPAQVGSHSERRASYGHALVVDPWGSVLADAGGDGEGLAIADLDPEVLREASRRIPCWDHRQPWITRRKDDE